MKFLAILVSLLGLLPSAYAASDRNPFDLIEEARAKGEITYAQSVLYRALAFRGDAPIPERFQGDFNAPQESVAETDLHLSELPAVLHDLAPADQELALRMIAPPAYVPGMADGVYNPGNGYPVPQPDPFWATIETTKYKIWYLVSDPNGERYAKAAAAAGDAVIAKLKGIMGREPLPDDGESEEYTTSDGRKVTIGNGGDGRIDVYMLPCPRGSAQFRAYANPYKDASAGVPTPGYIVFDTSLNLPDRRIKSVLMHETMHLVQFSFPKVKNHVETYNVGEGVSKWSEDAWDSASQYEHEWVDFFSYGWLSLLDQSYGTWTWYYFLVHELGSDIIRAIYATMAGQHPYDAIDTAIPNGFKKMWPEYLKKEWNQLPTEESFLEWDSLSSTPYESKTKQVQVKPVIIDASTGDFVDRQTISLKPLTRKYLAYSVPEGGTGRSFSVGVPHYWHKDKVQLRALVQYADSKGWKVEDWNDFYDDKELCLDDSKERIKKIVLIFSNYDRVAGDAPVEFESYVKTTNLGCLAYRGNVHGEVTTSGTNDHSSLVMDSEVEFDVEKRISDAGGAHMPGRFNLFSIKLSYTYDATKDKCSAHKTGSIERAGPSIAKRGTLGLYAYHTHEIPNGRMVSGSIVQPDDTPITVTFKCTDGRAYDSYIYLLPWMQALSGGQPMKAAPDSGVIQGEGDSLSAGGKAHYRFRFDPVAQSN